MHHRIKKVKFKGGYDANKMLIKKLAFNFLMTGQIKTTLIKAKVLKSKIERLVEKMKEENEKNKYFFLRYFGKKKILPLLFKIVGPVFKEVKGGYVRIIKIGQRDSDGAPMAKVEWTKPVVYSQKGKKTKVNLVSEEKSKEKNK